MTTINDFIVTDNSTDVLAAQYNLLLGSILRAEISNATTMAGTLQLADSDTAIQRCNCNGANRIVKLPAYSTGNHPFFIINTTAATYTLDVQSSAGVSLLATPLAALTGTAFVVPDGTAGYKYVSTPLEALVAPSTSGNVLTSNGTIWTSAAASSVKLAGDTVQVVNVETGAVATGTTLIPADDTIPQNTEGNEYMTLAITPTNASNKLLISITANMSSSVGTTLIAALFQDSVANALDAVYTYQATATGVCVITFSHYMVAGTTSATTFKIRCGGSNAGTLTFNGASSARIFGGVMTSSITITEIKV